MSTRFYIFLFSFLITSHTYCFAVNDAYPAGARSLALAQITTVLQDEWSGMNNQSASAFYDNSAVAVSYKSMFMLNTIGIKQALVSIKTAAGFVGANFQQLGYAGYLDSKGGIYYARKFGEKFSAGLQFDLLMVKPAYEEAMMYNFTGEISLMALLNPYLTLGFRVFNPIAAVYQTMYFDEPIPVIANCGIKYTISDQVFIAVEGEGHSNKNINLKFGLEYELIESIAVRMGAASEPVQLTFGAGVMLKGVKIDMAIQQVEKIGRSAGISFSYAF